MEIRGKQVIGLALLGAGWIVLMALAMIIYNAPLSAKRALRYAADKIWEPGQPFDPRVITGDELFSFVRHHGPQTYFPTSALDPGDKDEFLTRAFASGLEEMQEPKIYNSSTEAIRFIWHRSFHLPVCVRLYKVAEKEWCLCSKMINMTGDDKFFFEENRDVSVSPRFAADCIAILDGVGFWSAAADEGGGIDGAFWVFEAQIQGKYHVLQRHSPESGTPFYKLGIKLLKAGKVDGGPIY